ncbi:NAD-dependent epimerase/dehydratase family protein [Breoghania sp.]|uniref:NAD-dependent epimerase/dehydratase family protein n=1 Tax=Breoghania sp. TaxID=2065378 RepID=UPI002AABD58C|nr:NAD-dependent epimerase/dehydratase family protein [Breoghania sp.]
MEQLAADGHETHAVYRDNWPEAGRDLGHVIYTIGLTADFRGRPLETTALHVIRLHEVLSRYDFASLLYLSTTRVYRGAAATGEEADLVARPSVNDDIYNLTKMTGESLCLSLPASTIRVARLSNVYSPRDRSEVFLSSVLRDATTEGAVAFRTAPGSSKDYIYLDDAVSLLANIALSGKERLYNVASGINVSNETIAKTLRDLGVTVSFEDNAPETSFPPIQNDRIRNEFQFKPRNLETMLPAVFHEMQRGDAR